MIHLFYKNKFGKNIAAASDETITWHSFFKANEDSLSSSVFGLLLYLPVETLLKLINKACYQPTKFPISSKIVSYEFWPHWDNTGTENGLYVEPDIFIRFDTFDLIIEAKRYDFTNLQFHSQWEKEIKGYMNEYSDENKKMYFIALGGFKDFWQPQSSVQVDNKTYDIIVLGWKSLLNTVTSELDYLKEYNPVTDNHIVRILEDVVKAFELHNFYTGYLFNTLTKSYRIKHLSFMGNKIGKCFHTITPPSSLRKIDLHINLLKKWQPLHSQN